MGEEKQHGYLSTLVRNGAMPFARPPRSDAAFGGGERFRQPVSPFSKLQREVEAAPELSPESAAEISTEILSGSSRESSSHEPGASSAPIYDLPVRPDAPAFDSIEDGGAESEIVSISPTLEGHHEPSSRHANANLTQPPTGASHITSVTTDEGDKVPLRRLATKVYENSPALLSESETAKRSDDSETGAVYRRAQAEGFAQAVEPHQSTTPAVVSRSDAPHGYGSDAPHKDGDNLAAQGITLPLSRSLAQAEPQTLAAKISQVEQGDDRSKKERSAARLGEQPAGAAEKYDANPDAARPEEALMISPPSSSASHKVFTHDLRHLFRGESRSAPDGDLHAQKQTSPEVASVPPSLRRPGRPAESGEDNSEQEGQSETEGRASLTQRETVSVELAAKASQATGSPASAHSMVDERRESESQAGRGMTTPPANVRAVRRRSDDAVRLAGDVDGKSANQQGESGEPSPATSAGAFTSSEGLSEDGGAHGRSELVVAAAKNESREFNESLAARTEIAFGRRATPEQDASIRDAGAFSLKVNRLDVKLVNQAPKSPPAPPVRTSPAPKSEEYLERYYLGRFYLSL
jgi:hypothetical protein